MGLICRVFVTVET